MGIFLLLRGMNTGDDNCPMKNTLVWSPGRVCSGLGAFMGIFLLLHEIK